MNAFIFFCFYCLIVLNLKITPSFFEQLAKEHHIQSENYAIFNILSNGQLECSNSLEDDCDTEIPGQALIYRPARQHIYSVLLESGGKVEAPYATIQAYFKI